MKCSTLRGCYTDFLLWCLYASWDCWLSVTSLCLLNPRAHTHLIAREADVAAVNHTIQGEIEEPVVRNPTEPRAVSLSITLSIAPDLPLTTPFLPAGLPCLSPANTSWIFYSIYLIPSAFYPLRISPQKKKKVGPLMVIVLISWHCSWYIF